MAFLLFAIGTIFTLGWTLGLIFSLKSDAPRNPIIPGLGIVAFLSVSYISMTAAVNSLDNPSKLSATTYDSISDGMSMEQAQSILGNTLTRCPKVAGAKKSEDKGGYVFHATPCPTSPPEDEDEDMYIKLDLSGKGVSLPGEIAARLPQGKDAADAVSAKLSITIEGEPSKRNAKTGLGASAANDGNGVIGLQIVLTEGGNETTITEGKDWTYVTMDTAETVTQKIGQAIDAHASWIAVGGTDDAPKRIMIQSELASNAGERGNTMTCRAAPAGKNTAVRVGYRDDGGTVSFRGGQPSVALQFWLEKDQVLDGDFTLTDRLVVVGYVDNKVTAMKQAGLGETIRDLLIQRKSVQAKLVRVLEEKAKSPDPEKTPEARSIQETLDEINQKLAKKGHKA